MRFDLPALACDLRAWLPSTAASKARIVSSGRSMRLLVGLDRSGSTAGRVSGRTWSARSVATYGIAVVVLV